MIQRITLILILTISTLFAQDSKHQVIVATESWKNFTNEDGTGLYFDILRAVYEPIGIKVEIKIVPYARASKMVKVKKADLWLGSYINEETYAIYPRYFFDQDLVTVLYNKEKFSNFQSQEDLQNKNVSWIRGYEMDEYIPVKMNVDERNDRQSILLGLKSGRIDFYMDAHTEILDAIKTNNFKMDSYEIKIINKFQLYPAFRNDEKGELLMKHWDKRFKYLFERGEIQKLFTKYNYSKYYELLQASMNDEK